MDNKKISKREKIILIAMGLVVLYGAYSFFLTPSVKKDSMASIKKSLNDMNRLVVRATADLNMANLNDTETRTITLAETAWKIDPFLLSNEPYKLETDKEDGIDEAAKFLYSGFLQVDRRQMAIINGLEYYTGEELEMTGYTLREIEPKKVILETKTQEGAVKKIIVPLFE